MLYAVLFKYKNIFLIDKKTENSKNYHTQNVFLINKMMTVTFW